MYLFLGTFRQIMRVNSIVTIQVYKRFLSTFGMTILVSYQGERRSRPLPNIREKVIPNVERNLYNFTGIWCFKMPTHKG